MTFLLREPWRTRLLFASVAGNLFSAALIGAHLFLVTKLGTTAPPWLKAVEDEELREERV